MKRIITLLLAAVLTLCVFSLAGCGADKKSDGTSEQKDKKTFTVRLKANGTTGYRWSAKISDESKVKIDGKYEQDSASAGMGGVGGTQIFNIKGKKKGDVTVTFAYEAPGTQEIALVAVYELSIDTFKNITEKSHRGTYFEQDNIIPSKVFVINMPIDKESGYTWKYSLDKKDLATVSEDTKNIISTQNETSQSVQVFGVEGKASGEIILKFTYEKEGEPAPKYEAVYKLNIDENLNITKESETGSYFEQQKN